ncbi:MAG: twin-arginine translocation signal domain-containing protein [Alphaproteobacteria bacterium]|jgi:sulfur-oxidizing protein SoxY|nr:twin-arginine translocation signal domain-containing protein [Alphaproteobacteria bacterium]
MIDSTRRSFVTRIGGGAGAMALLTVVPHPASAETIDLPERESAILEAAFGSSVLTPGKISLDMPILAETGLSVPVTFKVDSPMTEADHVTRIMGFAPGNPEPVLADYQIGPRAGLAEVSTRIRLARTGFVYAAAKLSDGTLWGTKFSIIVTLGACVEDIFDLDWQRDAERRAMRAEARAAAAAE